MIKKHVFHILKNTPSWIDSDGVLLDYFTMIIEDCFSPEDAFENICEQFWRPSRLQN